MSPEATGPATIAERSELACGQIEVGQHGVEPAASGVPEQFDVTKPTMDPRLAAKNLPRDVPSNDVPPGDAVGYVECQAAGHREPADAQAVGNATARPPGRTTVSSLVGEFPNRIGPDVIADPFHARPVQASRSPGMSRGSSPDGSAGRSVDARNVEAIPAMASPVTAAATAMAASRRTSCRRRYLAITGPSTSCGGG